MSESLSDITERSSKKYLDESIAHRIIFITFVALGYLQLAGWNTLLFIIVPVEAELKSSSFSLLIRFIYGFVLLLGNLYFLKYSCVNLTALILGVTSVPVVLFLYAVVFSFFHSSINILYPLISVILTIGSIIIGVTGFGFAVRFKRNYSGPMSAGLGFSGAISYGLWTISTAFVDIKTSSGTMKAFWTIFALTFVLYLFIIGLLFYTIKYTEMGDVVSSNERRNSELDCEKDDNEESTEDDFIAGGYRLIFRKAWKMAIPTFSALFVTLLVFPAVGPVMWFGPNNVQMVTLHIGIFILGDLFGRYSPNILSILMFSPRVVHIITLLRWLFVPFFILSAIYPNNAFLGSVYYLTLQMILLSVTSGLMSTVTFVRSTETVVGTKAKEKVASFCLVMVALSIFLSQALGLILVKILLAFK